MFDPSSASSADTDRMMSEMLKARAEVAARLEAAESRWLQASDAVDRSEAA